MKKGKYVYVAVKEGDVMKARKKQVFVGENFGGRVEIKGNSLTATDILITEGYQSVYDGQDNNYLNELKDSCSNAE
jgi:hypothetical protein